MFETTNHQPATFRSPCQISARGPGYNLSVLTIGGVFLCTSFRQDFGLELYLQVWSPCAR